MECWSSLRNWISSEKKEIDFVSVLDLMKSSYLLIFDQEFRLTYINSCYGEHIGTIFSPLLKEDYKDRYHLSELLASFSLKNGLAQHIENLVSSNQTSYHLERPALQLKICYNSMKELESILIYISIEDKHIIDPDWSVNFVLQPISQPDVDPLVQRTIIGSPKTDDLISHYKKMKVNSLRRVETLDLKRDSFSASMKNLATSDIQTRTASPESQPKSKRSNFSKNKGKNLKPVLINSRTINFEGRPV